MRSGKGAAAVLALPKWFPAFAGSFVVTTAGLAVVDGVMESNEDAKNEGEIVSAVDDIIGNSGGSDDADEDETQAGDSDEDTAKADDESVASAVDDIIGGSGGSDNTNGDAADTGNTMLSQSVRDRIRINANLPSDLVSGGGRPGFTGRYLMGPREARVRVVLYSNPFCPSCRVVHKEVVNLMRTRDDVSLSVKQFPLESSCNPLVAEGRGQRGACTVAYAAEAAGIIAGPEGYWAMTEWLYQAIERGNGNIDIRQLVSYAQQMGIDRGVLQSVMNEQRVKDRVASDVNEGLGAGMTQPPFVVVNGTVVRSWVRPGDLTRTLNAVLASPSVMAEDSSNDTLPGKLEKLTDDWREGRRVAPAPSTHGRLVSTPADGSQGVRFVLFGDYVNDATRTVDAAIRERIAAGEPIIYEYRFFPLNTGCNPAVNGTQNGQACDMAYVVLRAGELGGDEAFTAMHERMMTIDPQISRAIIQQQFTELGLDATEALSGVASPTIQAMVRNDGQAWDNLVMRAVPLLLVEGRRVRWQDIDEVGEIIDAVLDAQAP